LRAALEYAQMRLAQPSDLPRGDGHAVVVFPGLASDRHATAPLTSFCEGLGYETHDWGRGFNTGPRGDANAWLDELAEHVANLPERPDADLSLIGWSLGGIYAREVAKRLTAKVRQVITIGSPFAGGSDDTHAGLVYRLLSGQKATLDAEMRRQLVNPPPVPTTSIYSRTDGVVAWQACVQSGNRQDTENVEVQGSHCGLGWNASVLEVVADRLSQPRGRWKPYRSDRWT
jgi:pimeloyl-ACP methyl ester carboxylesterase